MNVLLITSDEHRFDAVGCNGNQLIKTPNLDRLAQEGINLQNHSCSTPVCTPARASILTGQYSRTHGAWHVGYTLDTNKSGIADWLSESGFNCGFFGKAHFEPEMSNFAEHMDYSRPYYGFSEFHLTEDNPAGEYVDWIKENHSDLFDAVKKTFHEGIQSPPLPMREKEEFKSVYTSSIPEEIHQTAWIADRTIDFINKHKAEEKPFFAWCSFVDPHHPWIPPEPFASMYDPEGMPLPRILEGETDGLIPGYNFPEDMPPAEYQRMCAAYYAMISHIDYHIGKVIETLKKTGLYDNTIILYTSDHGDYNGDHGLIRKNPWLFDNVLRVPMIVRYPHTERSGVIYSGNTQHEDIAQTLLDLLELPIPDSVQGISFADVIKHGKGSSREYSFFDLMGKVGVQKGEYKLLYYPRSSWPKAANDSSLKKAEEFKLITYPQETDGFILTNIAEDPLEYHNLSGISSYADIEKALKNKLFEWLLTTPSYYPERIYEW